MSKEKIIIVEDNKALSKLIAKKMETHLNFEVDIAHSLAEAQVLIKKDNNYFIALLDLNLPDAPDGEVVDFMIEKKGQNRQMQLTRIKGGRGNGIADTEVFSGSGT